MNLSKKRKVLLVLCIILTSLVIFGSLFIRRPGVRFMLAMMDVLEPSGISSQEISIDLGGVATPMMEYRKEGAPPGRYYFFLHGVTPDSYRHPAMRKLATAIAGSTGRTVLVPRILGSETARTIDDIMHDIARIYSEIRNRYHGSFYAFGACVAGTSLLIAFNTIPASLYPEKIFMYGPFLNGGMLTDFYNTSGMEIDYIVRMTNAMRSRAITDGEKELISRAIMATKPGPTDRAEMKRILGDKLYRKVDELKIDNQEFKSINELTLFPAGKPLPKCRYYTLHSRKDNIIPYAMGLSMHRYLTARGLQSRFAATSVFQHTDRIPLGWEQANELFDLAVFLDDLFDDTTVQ